MPGKGRPPSRLIWAQGVHGKDERCFGFLLTHLQREPEQASKHAGQIPALNTHLSIPFRLLLSSAVHISAPLGLHQLQYLAIAFLYLPVGSVGYLLHSSFVIGHS